MINTSSSTAVLNPPVKSAGVSFLGPERWKQCIIVESQAFRICYECQELTEG